MEHHQITRQNVPRETFSRVDEFIEKNRDKLETYLDALFWWNNRVNLISRDVSRETAWEHIRHSLVISGFVNFKDAEHIVDAGTGGGLPGVPLAIAHPEKRYYLNDIVSKKMIALRQILLKLDLNHALAKAFSIEEMEFPANTLLITKHAFKINELWKMVRDKSFSEIIFYKGMEFEDELTDIDIPLQIRVFDLSDESNFYEGKSIIIVKPKEA